MTTNPVLPCACSRLRRATRAVTQFYDDALAPVDLRIGQYALLRTLARGGPTTIGGLAHTLLLDRTALSRTLDPLEARGYVAVTAGSDARTREATLTVAGRRALAAAEPHWAQAQREAARRVGSERLRELLGLLADLERLHPDLSAGEAQGHR
jgi:DNA-binding MarR family transcriptional regulator